MSKNVKKDQEDRTCPICEFVGQFDVMIDHIVEGDIVRTLRCPKCAMVSAYVVGPAPKIQVTEQARLENWLGETSV